MAGSPTLKSRRRWSTNRTSIMRCWPCWINSSKKNRSCDGWRKRRTWSKVPWIACLRMRSLTCRIGWRRWRKSWRRCVTALMNLRPKARWRMLPLQRRGKQIRIAATITTQPMIKLSINVYHQLDWRIANIGSKSIMILEMLRQTWWVCCCRTRRALSTKVNSKIDSSQNNKIIKRIIIEQIKRTDQIQGCCPSSTILSHSIASQRQLSKNKTIKFSSYLKNWNWGIVCVKIAWKKQIALQIVVKARRLIFPKTIPQ